MRVNRLREILDGPFLLREDNQHPQSTSEQRAHDLVDTALKPADCRADRAERED
ncbi:MAG: hypothetical protein PVH40_03500 [Gemmatimonadales bacterium]|jgi:hypothetical protein